MKKIALTLVFFSTLLTIGKAGVPATKGAGERWYSSAQVAQGQLLYRTHCAPCHGAHAEATPDWRQPDANGLYPPPPLNGTAHTWHHPLPQLRLTIRHGGASFGGKMPPFKAILSASEIDSIIAWFQSLWPDEIYRQWATRGQSQISRSGPAP